MWFWWQVWRTQCPVSEILVARDYKPGKVKNHFCDIKSISSEEARKPKNNKTFSALCKLITQYNKLIPNIKTIIKVYLPVLQSSH